MLRVAVFVSGGGTNLQALIDAQKAGKNPNGEIALVLSSSKKAYALERARQNGIATEILPRRQYATADAYDEALLQIMERYRIDLVVLAGFMCILGSKFTKAYDRRIINVHPSLIPSFCGDGFYGIHVHEAALSYGVKVTGATVHFVNEITDGGQIIMQKAVDVLPNDTPETLQRRVMKEAEWVILPKTVQMICNGEIQ